jgi:hypothetical protein
MIKLGRVLTRHLTTHARQSSVNDAEIGHFSRLSHLWWDEQGEFGLLHKMNPVRMQYIKQKLSEAAMDDGVGEGDDQELEGQSKVLRGKDVLDVGCGGGLLSEVRVPSRIAIDSPDGLTPSCPHRALPVWAQIHWGLMPPNPTLRLRLTMRRSTPNLLGRD